VMQNSSLTPPDSCKHMERTKYGRHCRHQVARPMLKTLPGLAKKRSRLQSVVIKTSLFADASWVMVVDEDDPSQTKSDG
jgi:hypothetical protein